MGNKQRKKKKSCKAIKSTNKKNALQRYVMKSMGQPIKTEMDTDAVLNLLPADSTENRHMDIVTSSNMADVSENFFIKLEYEEPQQTVTFTYTEETENPLIVANELKEGEMASDEEIEIALDIKHENEHSEDPLAVLPNAEAELNNYKTVKSNKILNRANDIQEMTVIARNILRTCKEAETNPTVASQIHKIQFLTKQPLEYLKEESIKGSLKQALLDTKPLPQNVTPHIYGDIRDIFVDFYVKKKQMPTVIGLLKNLHDKRDHVSYKYTKFRKLVKNNLVKYHHLPKLRRYILCENPEFTYQRHLYLRQIIGYRARGKKIIYVTVLKIQSDGKPVAFMVIAASPTDGLIANSDSISYAGTYDDEVGNDQVKLWMRYELLPQLSSDAVVVLMQPRKKDTTPTPFSSKVDMISWLQKRDISFDAESHIAQLYSLVKIFKKKKEPGFYEEILTSGGLQVVDCPTEYQNLDFFDFHNICSKVNSNVSAFLENLMRQLSREEWKLIEEKIIEEESQMMRDDEAMQTIVDNLLQMAKNGDLKEEDFPAGCRASKADNFAVHIGDIIID